MVNTIAQVEILKYVKYLFSGMISKQEYKNTYGFLGVLNNGKMKNIPINLSNLNNDNYLHSYVLNNDYNYYVSGNIYSSFKGKRKENAFSVENLIIDIDNHVEKDYGKIERYIQKLLYQINVSMKIKPSGVVFSGRGCQLIYKIENVSYKLGWMVEKTTKGIIKRLNKIIKENNIDLSVDEGASKYHGYFRAVGSINPKTGTTVTFTDYHRKYTLQQLYDEFNEVQTKTPKTDKNSKYNDRYNCCCQLYQLTKKRLNLTYQRLNQLQDCGQVEGYRDKILFPAYACYYAQNKDTAKQRLIDLNSSLISPLQGYEIDNIQSYIDSKGGVSFKDETFLAWLDLSVYDAEYQEYMKSARLKKERAERSQKRKERNIEIIDKYNQGIETDDLAIEYNLTVSQINRITFDVRQNNEKQYIQRVVDGRNQGKSLNEIGNLENKSKNAIFNILKKYKNKSSHITHDFSIYVGGGESPLSEPLVSMVCPKFVMSVDKRSLDVSNVLSVNSLIDTLSLGFDKNNYPNIHRYVNNRDINILKVIYTYASIKFGDSYSLDSQPILMGIGLLKYLCLPMGAYIPKYEKFKPLKKLIKKRLGCDALKSVDFRYSYAQDKLLTASLRKLLYLGFIKGFKGSSNGLSGFILSSLDLSSAEDKAKSWFDKSLMFKHICSDSYLSQYLSQSDLDKMMFVKGCEYNHHYLGNLFKAVSQALQGNEYLLLSSLPNNQRNALEQHLNIFKGYSIIKVKNKLMINQLSLNGVSVGSKIVIRTSLIE